MNNVQDVVCIDGIYYNVRIPENGIKRSFSVADTDNAGRLLDGTMVRDIIGTYYNYTVQFDTQFLSFEEYDKLYDQLSAPRDYHTITVPYGQGRITFFAYVTSGSDTLQTMKGGNKWKGLSINFIAMSPYHKP